MHTIKRVAFEGEPPPWGVTSIGGFVDSALARTQREGRTLPNEFFVSFCPWGERNAAFHGLSGMADVFEPQFRLVHFTSCGKPYLIAILTGPDAKARQSKAMRYLPWSEHYHCRIDGDRVRLRLMDAVEDIDVEPPASIGERSLRKLFESGKIVDL